MNKYPHTLDAITELLTEGGPMTASELSLELELSLSLTQNNLSILVTGNVIVSDGFGTYQVRFKNND